VAAAASADVIQSSTTNCLDLVLLLLQAQQHTA
jgi:hypothetical protein